MPNTYLQTLGRLMKTPYDNLILFDGLCNLCTKSVQFIIRHDQHEVFIFASVQSPLGRDLLQQAGLDPDDVQSFALITSKQTLTRSDAALEIAKHFGGIWRLSVVLRFIPKPWRDGLYSFIARRRFAWFGRRDSCLIPSENLKKRFLS